MNRKQVNRRKLLTWGTGAAGAFLASARSGFAGGAPVAGAHASAWPAIEQIIQAHGKFDHGVFSIQIDRKDMAHVTLHGVRATPSFQINGTLVFQPHASGVFMNADMALKPAEVDPFIDALLAHGIEFQAEHQHFLDFSPNVWFIHFRQAGNALDVARNAKAALGVTATPFPQSAPAHPTTPLPAKEIGAILGAKPDIGSDGVVTYDIPRKEPLLLGGARINPYLNVETNIPFQPLNGGKSAAAAPDFGMIAAEINPVAGLMRRQGWDVGCLYNQETAENPQLYFSHQFKTGDPLALAREIRKGLDLMNVPRA